MVWVVRKVEWGSCRVILCILKMILVIIGLSNSVVGRCIVRKLIERRSDSIYNIFYCKIGIFCFFIIFFLVYRYSIKKVGLGKNNSN